MRDAVISGFHGGDKNARLAQKSVVEVGVAGKGLDIIYFPLSSSI